MNCYLCGSGRYIEILNKRDVYIWTNASDEEIDKKRMYKCVLNQCKDCGHIYQPVNDGLRNILNGIYLSDNAQVSTPLGKGNWGLERAEHFLDKIDFKNYTSAVEIGCADGYILRCLKNRGFEELVGVDPSISKTERLNGISFIKDFADEKLKLSQKYNLIFSNGVFEHVENINSLIGFCKNNLSENGEVLFSVPNAQRQLEDGDPGLFLHQHIHYYTRQSLACLLSKNGFLIKRLMVTQDAFIVNAKISNRNFGPLPKVLFYDKYQEKLEKILMKVKNILQGKRVVIHGANNALNNILGWLDQEFDFTLVDNDNTKHGKRYFGKIVNFTTNFELADYEVVLIIPVCFYETIKRNYIARGFNGKFKGTLLSDPHGL